MTVITANNGRLAANLLAPTRTGQRLRHSALGAYNRLDAHMRAAGQGALTLSTGLSGYRTLAEQQHMRNLGLTTIAVGRSPHGEGYAADFQGLGGLSGGRYRWLRSNAGPFGWFHPPWAQAGGVNPSAHHWEYDPLRDTGAGRPPSPPHVERDDDMYLIRIVDDDRIVLVTPIAWTHIVNAEEFRAWERVLGSPTDVNVQQAAAIHTRIAHQKGELVHAVWRHAALAAFHADDEIDLVDAGDIGE